MKQKKENVAFIIGFIILVLFFLFCSSCNKVDNSELCRLKVIFYNQRGDTINITIKETGSVVMLLSGDSINYPKTGMDIPTLTCLYSIDTVFNNICGIVNRGNRWNNVKERNVIK
jgi:hypothetical protein